MLGIILFILLVVEIFGFGFFLAGAEANEWPFARKKIPIPDAPRIPWYELVASDLATMKDQYPHITHITIPRDQIDILLRRNGTVTVRQGPVEPSNRIPKTVFEFNSLDEALRFDWKYFDKHSKKIIQGLDRPIMS